MKDSSISLFPTLKRFAKIISNVKFPICTDQSDFSISLIFERSEEKNHSDKKKSRRSGKIFNIPDILECLFQ